MKRQFIREIGIHNLITYYNVLGMTSSIYKAFKSKRTPAGACNA
jgi:hypothetical protein